MSDERERERDREREREREGGEVKYARNEENHVNVVIMGSNNSNVSRDLIIESSVKIVR
jgi:hypothetical protein